MINIQVIKFTKEELDFLFKIIEDKFYSFDSTLPSSEELKQKSEEELTLILGNYIDKIAEKNKETSQLRKLMSKIQKMKQLETKITQKFKGDIIITDPCYIVKDEDDYKVDYNNLEESIGLCGISSKTIYGDWSCTVFDYNGKELGNFCADAGMVGVFNLKNVLEYNPEFDYHINKPWTTALIKDFDGEIFILCKLDETNEPYITIEGKGNIDFYTEQTGF